MYIKFSNFLNEYSRFDPIPELTWNKKNKTAIFIFGVPGGGKTTFLNNFIINKLRNYKIFDPDKIAANLLKIGKTPVKISIEDKYKKLDLIKDAIKKIKNEYNIEIQLNDEQINNIIDNNTYYDDMYNILKKQLLLIIEHSEADIIYDTSGNDFKRVDEYTKIFRKYGYTILFIKVNNNLETAVYNNLNRDRKVELDYQLSSYERSLKLESEYLKLNPDAYYIYDIETNKFNKKVG
jgi:hypothetical protein